MPNATKQKELLIVMTIYDGGSDSDKILNQRVYNFLDPYCRQKIAKTAWWAMHSGHEMVTRPKEQDEEVDIIGTHA